MDIGDIFHKCSRGKRGSIPSPNADVKMSRSKTECTEEEIQGIENSHKLPDGLFWSYDEPGRRLESLFKRPLDSRSADAHARYRGNNREEPHR